jgi:YVTN family beta-propeller protein
VIDTATKTVVATVPIGTSAIAFAFTPDGKHAYIANADGTVSVFRTATNKVVATVMLAPQLGGVAVNPDGKHAYVTFTDTLFFTGIVNVIDTATKTVVAGVLVGANGAFGIAVTPDGKHAYVTDETRFVTVIDTATNTAEPTGITVGIGPFGIAITPDGKHAYVANNSDGTVSVIRTATNTVVATVPVGNSPDAVGIVPPPPGVPFLAFSVTALAIEFDGAPTFNLHSQFTLSSTAPAINSVTQPVTLQVGTFSTTIPAGSFTKQPDGSFFFAGVIDGVSLKAQIRPTGTLQYTFHAKVTGARCM